jgi:hypothetical protein
MTLIQYLERNTPRMEWNDIIEGTSFSIYKIDLSDENYSFKQIPISNKGVA